MYNYDEFKTREMIEKLRGKIADVSAKAASEKRSMNPDEAGLVAEMYVEVSDLEKHLARLQPERPLTVPMNGPVSGASYHSAINKLYALKNPRDKKGYYDLFGNTGYQWQDRETTFFDAVFSGRHHPGLIRNSGMNETVPSDGGFLVPVEYAQQIHSVSLENEIIMPRCFVQPMASNTCNIPAMNIGDHSASLYGGFTASYTGEAGTITENNPKTRNMELNAKKLTGLLRFSSELASDVPGGFNQIINICGKGLGFYRDKAFLKGSGSGEPLGILNAPCLIEVAKETGQAADTVIYENLTKMMAAMYAGGFANSVWICHQSTIPQLLQLTIAVGTGGEHIPVLKENNGQFSILTRPVIFTEKTEKLGDKGDIVLADLSQYVVGLRSEMRFDLSIHAHFTTDEQLARLIERHDGMPLWGESLTLEDGSTKVSPFVTLAAR